MSNGSRYEGEATMRLAIALITVTIAGLCMLAFFRSTPMPGTAPPPAVGAPASVPAPAHARQRTVTGPEVQTMFGPVQVKVKLDGQRMVDVQAIHLPSDFALSQQISNTAGPMLRQEALAAQSARIDSVSGATYTSRGYQQSLQAALDEAGI
jgi:uncharacterized protein with FMN-binding domain